MHHKKRVSKPLEPRVCLPWRINETHKHRIFPLNNKMIICIRRLSALNYQRHGCLQYYSGKLFIIYMEMSSRWYSEFSWMEKKKESRNTTKLHESRRVIDTLTVSMELLKNVRRKCYSRNITESHTFLEVSRNITNCIKTLRIRVLVGSVGMIIQNLL